MVWSQECLLIRHVSIIVSVYGHKHVIDLGFRVSVWDVLTVAPPHAPHLRLHMHMQMSGEGYHSASHEMLETIAQARLAPVEAADEERVREDILKVRSGSVPCEEYGFRLTCWV